MDDMRTNIVIDEALMAEAREVAGTSTKRETVELALRGTVSWAGDLDRSRAGR